MRGRGICFLGRNSLCNIKILTFFGVSLMLMYMLRLKIPKPSLLQKKYTLNYSDAPSKSKKTFEPDEITSNSLLLQNKYIKITYTESKKTYEPDKKCVHPKLDPYHPSLLKYFFKLSPLKCSEEENWVYVTNGTFHISKSIYEKYGEILCDIYPMVRTSDFNTDYGSVIKNVKNGTTLTSDFFKAECKSAKGDHSYSNVHSGIAYNKDVHDRVPNMSENSIGFDILMVGFDSISRMTSIRKFVKAREYFLNELKGFELEDYNILGDGTPAAILPILTAQTEEELPEARRGHSGAKPVDGHPWIWNDFKKLGYATAYAEDTPGIGTFHYRMLGFHNQPTDHYMRNFYIAADRTVKKDFCFGSKPKHVYFLDWLRDMFWMYSSKRKFVFGFHSEMSHENSNEIDYLDEDVTKFFHDLNTNGYLNNTLLIFFSDHGARFSKNREAAQGKHEERMPMFMLRFPPWFKSKYPEVSETLKINAHRLTTPFDIHETLKDILHYSGTGQGDLSKRGISLFKEISKERTCQNAAVEAHWCACLDWKPVDESDTGLLKVLQTIQSSINNFTAPHRTKCAAVSIKEVKSALKFNTNNKVLSFKQDNDFSALTKNSDVLYQVTVVTQPGNGHFETTVYHSLTTDTMTMSQKDISRTNAYGSDPDCVAKDFPYLRQFCYCKRHSPKL